MILGSPELRRRARRAIGIAVALCVIAYFVYHVIHGDRGLIAWQVLDQEVAAAKADLERTRNERKVLEQRVRLLKSESLDLDMLDEWTRRILNYGLPDEAVIFTTEEDAASLPATPRPDDER